MQQLWLAFLRKRNPNFSAGRYFRWNQLSIQNSRRKYFCQSVIVTCLESFKRQFSCNKIVMRTSKSEGMRFFRPCSELSHPLLSANMCSIWVFTCCDVISKTLFFLVQSWAGVGRWDPWSGHVSSTLLATALAGGSTAHQKLEVGLTTSDHASIWRGEWRMDKRGCLDDLPPPHIWSGNKSRTGDKNPSARDKKPSLMRTESNPWSANIGNCPFVHLAE